MAATPIFEQITSDRLVALSLVDALARSLRLKGEFPPPVGDVTCEVTAAIAPRAVAFAPPRPLWSFRNSSDYIILDGSYTRAGDTTRRWPLASGTYTVRVRGENYQDASFTLVWPPASDQSRVPVDANGVPLNIDLLPGPEYPLPDTTLAALQLGPTLLRGTTFSAAGDAIAGVLVEIVNLAFIQPPELPPLGNWPFIQAVSDDSGSWAIVLPGRRYYDNTAETPPDNTPLPLHRQFTVRIHYPAGVVDTVEDVVLGTLYSVRNTALRGQVFASGRPVAGARLTSSVNAKVSTSRSDGSWVLYFDPNQAGVPNITVRATLASGASLSTVTTLVSHSTVVVPAFQFP